MMNKQDDLSCDDLACDDDELVAKACEGNPHAFTRLVECNQDQLFFSLNRFLGSHTDAEEAVQEAFIRAFTRIDTYNHNSKFSTWLYRIAFNAAMSDKRKKSPSLSLDARIELTGQEVVDKKARSSSDQMIQDEEIALIHQALSQLTDDHRAILVLRELDDLAYEHIAEVLQISIGTVRSRLASARGRLREVIEALQGNVADA